MKIKYFNNKRIKVENFISGSKEGGYYNKFRVLYRNYKKGLFQQRWLLKYENFGEINLPKLTNIRQLNLF